MLPCNISPSGNPSWTSIICYRATFPPLAIPRERASYVTVQHFPLWQSLVNEHHMLPCNISPSGNPSWTSIICYRATFPLSGNPSWTSIICYCATFPPLAIPHERASYVTVQHFPLWQSLMNEHHMLLCNISPSLAIPHERHHMLPCNISPLWQSLMSIICYNPPLNSWTASYVTVQHFPLWQSLVNEHHMLPCNISPLWQSLMNEHHMLLCNISPLWQSLMNEHHMLPCNISPIPVTVQQCPLSGNPSWTASYFTVQHFPSLAIPHERASYYCATIPPLW